MTFPRYAKYKDSGVEWLGEVPAHWDVRRVRWLCEIRKRISGELGHEVLSITQQGIRVKDLESNDGQISMDYSKYQFVEVGDFAMNHMDLLTGYVDIANMRGVTSPDYRVFAIRDPSVCDDQYLLYLFQMGYKNKIFYAYGQGSSQLGRWRLPTEQFNDLRFPLPSKVEQQNIAAFLDRETAKIDGLVAEQRRLMELLKEKRQAVISHAVTQGLNPHAPMKPSGIEWLGDVPKHWRIAPLRWYSKCCSGDGLSADEVESVEDETHTVRVIGGNGLMGYTTHGNVEHSVLAVGRVGALCGNVHIVNPSAWITDNALIVDPDPSVLDLMFLSYSLLSRNLNNLASKSAQPLITGTQISDQRVPTPPLTEQQEIADFLGNELAKFDTLTAEAQHAIDLLQERRTALISAAVTGQINVCDTAWVEARADLAAGRFVKESPVAHLKRIESA